MVHVFTQPGSQAVIPRPYRERLFLGVKQTQSARRLFNRKTNKAMEEIAMRNLNQELFRLRQPKLLRFRPAGDAIRAFSGKIRRHPF